MCGVDVFNARNEDGRPCYLAFYYYRICGNGLYPGDLTFGDRIVVDTLVCDSGRLSVFTAHRIRRDDGSPDTPFDPVELHGSPRPGCLYVENLNVWLTRSEESSNVGLIRAAPVGFDQRALAPLTEAYSPRALCARARDGGAFPDPAPGPWLPVSAGHTREQEVDAVHDVNGVGLLYFASFFSLAESAVLRQWRERGLDARSYLDLCLLDARICYLGNADVDTTLAVSATVRRSAARARHERCDVSVRDQATGRTIAVAAFEHLLPLPQQRPRP
ncbi:putative biosynthetic protein (TIGR04098 family) [Kitasatospora sp. SolWspMP-SS2h]|nr:putative biosynthetic protein (TIGR04098 family) [Kitasatospora sp. SolWspMP-SS2h]